MAIRRRHVKAVIQLRRATEQEWVNHDPILRLGEPAYSTDVNMLKIGDGTHRWSEIEYLFNGDIGEIGDYLRLVNKPSINNVILRGNMSPEVFQIKTSELVNDLGFITQAERDKYFVYNQQTPSTRWDAVHNLGKYPTITVVDSAGTEVIGDYIHINENRSILEFSGAFSGKAIFN